MNQSADGLPVELPVEEVVPELRAALARTPIAVLVAPPGSGKTTIVPLRLVDEPWLDERRILVLEPRRLATRAAAHRMATLLGQRVGETVGYTTRDDRAVGPETRIEVVTEGVLTRRLQNDPELAGTGAVIFDEFHERNLQTDLGLALTLDVQQSLRPDLRVLLMSATIDADELAAAIGRHLDLGVDVDLDPDGDLDPDRRGDQAVPVLRSAAREHPVDVRYVAARPAGRRGSRGGSRGGGRRGGAGSTGRLSRRDLARQVGDIVHRALDDEVGDVLVFLPGLGEINAVAAELEDSAVLAEVHRLHGGLSLDEQDAALQPSIRRKVVLSTDIAETSLTVEGVRIVIDSGLARKPRFDTHTGMTRLQTVSVSQASADQRTGRAGRTEPGVAYRLWSKVEHAARNRQRSPEITQVDLAGLVLELRAWGLRDPDTLFFLDPPPPKVWDEAEALLCDLGALSDGALTELGRQMVNLPTHPRLAAMILESDTKADRRLACVLAALLDERDPLAGNRPHPPADLALRVQLLAGELPRHDLEVDRRALRRVERTADDLARRIRSGGGGRLSGGGLNASRVGRCLALAFPDRLATARGSKGRFQLRTGTTAWVPEDDPLASEQFVVAADVDGKRKDARIRMAAALDQIDVFDRFERHIETQTRLLPEDGRVMEHRVSRIGGVVLAEAKRRAEPGAETAAVLTELVRRDFDLLDWGRPENKNKNNKNNKTTKKKSKSKSSNKKSKKQSSGKPSGASRSKGNRPSAQRAEGNGIRFRVMAVRDRLGDPWPDWSDQGLLATIEQWLRPSLLAATSTDELNRLDPNRMLERTLDPRLRAELDRLAPTHLELSGGRRLPIDYREEGPTVSSRAQDFFGLNRHPDVAGEPLVIELLSPAQRPIQTTRDLPGFWSGTWTDVRKEMAGRYPKHDWPEDPSG